MSATDRWLSRRHLILGWVWIVLAVPALLWWKDSVLFVILLSLYANCETSFAAHQAKKRAEKERSTE